MKSNVRETAKSSLSAILFLVLIYVLYKVCREHASFLERIWEFRASHREVLDVYIVIIRISYITLISVSLIHCIFRQYQFLYSALSFMPLIVFMGGILACFNGQRITSKSHIYAFWLTCIIGLCLCSRVLFWQLSNLPGSASNKLSHFFKKSPTELSEEAKAHLTDARVLYYLQLTLLVQFAVLILLSAAFIYQYFVR